MQLDFNPANGQFVLKVPRLEGDPMLYVREYGMDFFAGSPANAAILSTKERYCAASFWHCATERAKAQLIDIVPRIEKSWAPSSDRHIDVPADKELWPFQRASADYLLDVDNGLDSDQPGLGKTPTAIAIANEIQAKRVLVVCPASIRHQWQNMVTAWSTDKRKHQLGFFSLIKSSRRGVDNKAPWTIVSWELVRSPGIWRALAKLWFDLLILDEAHYAKRGTTQRTRSIFGGGENPIADPLLSRAKKVVALTGTPLPNRPLEAYTLSRGLCFDAVDFMSQDAFEARFNHIDLTFNRDGKVVDKDEYTGREPELQNRLRANYMVRHLKREVMPQLHMPVYDLVRLEETAMVKAALAAEKLLDIDPSKFTGRNAETLGHIAEARRLMGIAMAPQIGDYIDMLLEGGEEKLVVFAWHIAVMNILEERLAKWNVLRVDGRTSALAKAMKVDKFRLDARYHVILGNVLTLGTGTDGLQEVASHALLAEPDWVHANNEQCFDRLDRGGQNRTVQGDIFVVPGSLSEKVLASALANARTVHKALDRRPTDVQQYI